MCRVRWDRFRNFTWVMGAGLLLACNHPLEIVGEGDILSASGTRDCYLEDFRAGADSCSKNVVVDGYRETYYAVPRNGWDFVAWENYCTDGASAEQCSFNVPAELVRIGFGLTAPSLVAVFQQQNPPPVALYSYALDSDGVLQDPLPLEGAQLQRRVVYFTFTGDFESASFWCCKVPEGDEGHAEKVEDHDPPLVLEVNLALLPIDDGLERELYADLFVAAGDYNSHAARWSLISPRITEIASGSSSLGAVAINNHDEIVWRDQIDGVGIIYSSKRGQISDGTNNSNHPRINDGGEIIWHSALGDTGHNAIVSNVRGIVYMGQCKPFDPYYTSLDINNHGEIVWGGRIDCTTLLEEIWSSVRGRLTYSADNSSNRDLSINDEGEVVYWSETEAAERHLISTEQGAITDRGDLWPETPDISNTGEIVWVQRRDPLWAGTAEVWSSKRGRITENTGVVEQSPKLNDSGEIVWMAWDGHDFEIYSSLRGQITDNETEDYYPAINSRGTIAWTSGEWVGSGADRYQRRSVLAIYGQQ